MAAEWIGPMTEGDIESVLAIETAVFPLPWSRESLLSQIGYRYAMDLVVKMERQLEKENICAYSCNHLIGTELEILRIAVDLKYRRLGIGSRLLDAVLSRAMDQGATEAFLEVRPSNASALALYTARGFQVVGRRINYYSETGEDALVMMKQLKETS